MRTVEHAGELREHVVAEPAELVAADLGLGPRPDHRAVALVEVGEAADPRRCSAAAPAGPASSGPSASASACISLGDLGREAAEQVLLVGEVEVEGAVRGLGELHDVVDAGGVVALRARRRRRPRRGAGASCAGRGRAAPGLRRWLPAGAQRAGFGGSRRRGTGVRVRRTRRPCHVSAARPDWAGPAPLRSDADVSVPAGRPQLREVA